MQQHSHNISLAVPNDGFVDELKNMFPGVNIFIIPVVRNISITRDINALWSYFRLFKQQKFDIIHLHTPKAGLLGSIAGRLLFHSKIVFHLHGLVSLKFNKLKPSITLFMEWIPLLLSHKVICVSKSLSSFCINKRLISKDKISVLLNGSINGIDHTGRFNRELLNNELPQLEAEIKPNNQFVIGFLGRMCEDKGLVDTIKTANLLSTSIPDLMMVFVGPNEMECDFHNYLETHLTVPFKYYPRTKQPELFIAAFDLMLFPSYREGFGLVAAEANSLEIPVIAYDIPGLQDAIENNITGSLVEAGNVNKIVDAIIFYYQHPDIKKQHGINGRQRVIEKFTPEDLWKAQLHFYEELVN